MPAEDQSIPSIHATEYLGPDGATVQAGGRTGDALADALDGGTRVRISFVGVRAPHTSYFNELLRRVVDRHDVSALTERVIFDVPHGAVKFVFDRSFAAVTAQRSSG